MAQIGSTVTFNNDSIIKTRKICEDGKEYVILSHPDLRCTGKEGAPAVPYKYMQFIVPNDGASYKVEINYADQETYGLSIPIIPVQKPIVPSINSVPAAFISPDPNIYDSYSAYPEELVNIVNDGYFDGDKRIITVKVASMQYVASERKVILNRHVSFLLRPYRQQTASERTLSPIYSSIVKSEEELAEELSFVENKKDISAFTAQSVSRAQSLASTPSMPQYLIVTSQVFVSTLEKLAFWKRLKGLTTGIVTIESILSDPTIHGDEVSGISDNAGKLRQYLNYAYQNGTQFVFLVGKDIPFRYGTGVNNKWQFGDTNCKIPSDLYFSDLNGNWNVDKDQYYGEPDEDEVDYLPELYVGRLLCENVTELKNYLSKLFCYEMNPGNGDPFYLKKALYTQSDFLQRDTVANVFASKLLTLFTTHVIRQELPGYSNEDPYAYKGSQIINDMNEHYGLVNFNNHGADFGMVVLTKFDNHGGISGIAYCDAYDEDPDNWISGKICEPGNGVDCLTNIGYPFIVYSTSCSTMPYDKLSDIPYNLGEAFTVMGKYGAIAYLGNTRTGYGGGYSASFAKGLRASNSHLGVIEALSKHPGEGEIDHFNALSHNMLGCPETQIWKTIPKKVPMTYMNRTNNQVIVKISGAELFVNLIGMFNGNSYLSSKSGGSIGVTNVRFDNVPANYMITTSSNSYLPYINSFLYLQNEEVLSKESIFFVENVYMGNHVTDTKPTGDFVIKKGSDVSVEYSGEAVLDKGFEIEEGAIFQLIPAKE